MSIGNDTTTQALHASMDLRLRRQALLASNMANIDTPNYRPVDVAFDGFLADNEEGKLDIETANKVVVKPEGVEGLDGNGVDLDSQVYRLTDNTIRYSTAMELMRRKMALLRYAATGGRG